MSHLQMDLQIRVLTHLCCYTLLMHILDIKPLNGSKTTENCFILFLRSLKTFHLGSFCSFEQPLTIRGMGLSCVYTRSDTMKPKLF